MQSKMAKKILTGILTVSLMLQMSMPVAYAEESTLIQETKTITAFAELAEDVKSITVPMGTTEEELALPEMIAATEESTSDGKPVNLAVTWASDKTFSSEEAGEFTYTAKLTEENYTLAEGVKMPAISVNVVKQSAMLLTQSPAMTLVNGATDGGDITQEGLYLMEGLPDKMTQYKAGNGYVLFTPASQSVSGKATLELNNATIYQEQANAILLPSGKIDLVLKGRNELQSNLGYVDACGDIAGVNTELVVTGDGTLTAKETANSNRLGYGIYLEGTSSFVCDSSTALGLNLAAYTEYGDNKAKQEVFGSVVLTETLQGGADLILHNDAQLTLQRPDGLGGVCENILAKNLSIGQNAKLVIEDTVGFRLLEWDGYLPVVTNNGGEIIVKGTFLIENSSYLKDFAKMNIITQGKGKVLFQGQTIDAVSGKLKFDDSIGIRLSGANGGEYSCGQGTIKWEPVVDDQGELISGTLTLNNADIIMKEGNKGAITVYEGKKVPITLNIIGNNTIENSYDAGIDMDNLTLTGSGTLTGKGRASIVYETKLDFSNFSGKLNSMMTRAVYEPPYGMRFYGTAYGTVSYTGGEFCQTFTVEKDAGLTIEPGSVLNANAFTNNGTIINNGTLSLQRDANDDELKNWVYDSLLLKGNGIVKVRQEGGSGYALFTNDGQLLHKTYDAPLDFSHAIEDQGDLAKDGYHWDNQAKKLTLQNLAMWGNPPSKGITAISLPEGQDVTLELKGYNTITGFKSAVYQGSPEMTDPSSRPEAKGSLTIFGDGTLVTENQTFDDKNSENILTTTGKFIFQSGNLLMSSISGGKTGLACVGAEIKGGSIGRENFCVPMESFGDFTMSGGKVITGYGDGANLMVYGNLTLSGGELTLLDGNNGIMLMNGNLSITGGKLMVQNRDSISSMGIAVQITGKEDKKISISGGTVDIKSGISAVMFAAYSGGTGKGVIETNGMTLTTNPEGGTLKSVTINIPIPETQSMTMYALTADESLKTTSKGILSNACTALTAVKASSKPSDEGNSNSGNSNSGSSSGHHGGGSSAATTASTAKTNPSSVPTQATTTVTSTVTNGTANVTVSQSTVAEAIKKAQEEAKKNGNEKNGIAVEIKVDTKNSNASNLSANLPKAVVDDLVKEQVKEASINTDSGKMSFDLETLKNIQQQVGADVNVLVKKIDSSTLSAEAKAVVGNRPVFDFSITGANGTKVTDFGKGKITVSIPYILGANEKAENLVAYYIDNEGKIQEMPNCVYDEKSKTLSFVTNHFSMYAVGYKGDATIAFTDIATHWAKEEIQFVTAKGLFSGTAQGKFSPNMPMTRGMFVTVLGRLAKADVSSYTNSSFTDVKANAYYRPYIQWAGEKGITKGVSKTAFAPDQSITREQMAVIMASYAKATGFELPQVNKESTFADNGEISSYAKEAVKQMQMSGVLTGKDGNQFDPKGTATRAEVSAVLKRFAELVEKK